MVRLRKVIVVSETQLSWRPEVFGDCPEEDLSQLRQYLPRPKVVIELVNSLADAAHSAGVSVEWLVLDDLPTTMDKLKASRRLDTVVWIVSDGRRVHHSGPLDTWLRLIGQPSFGADTTIQSLTDNKYLMTVIANKHGINIPSSLLFRAGEQLASVDGSDWSSGYFVKPNALGSQVGITKANHVATLDEAANLSSALHDRFDVDAIVQSYVPGRDIRVSVVDGLHDGPCVLCQPFNVVDGEGRGQAFSTSRAATGRDWVLDDALHTASPEHKAIMDTVKTFLKLGLIQDYAGLDVRLSDKGEPIFIENNVKPFVDIGSFQQLAECVGFSSMGELFFTLIERKHKLMIGSSRRYIHS